jgi:hypothetical protein
MIKLPLYLMGLVQKGSAGRWYHSQKQELLGAMVAISFDSELSSIRSEKSS